MQEFQYQAEILVPTGNRFEEVSQLVVRKCHH